MSSSIWSVDTERSSSSLSWEEECDEESEKYLQNLLDSIDRVVFFDSDFSNDFPNELREECIVWKNKFNKKMESNNVKPYKKSQKLKSLSAPKLNSKLCQDFRTLSEKKVTSKVTKLESINNISSNCIKGLEVDQELKPSQKPLILPPITHPNSSKINQNRSNNVPKFSQMFPKPPPILSIDQILCRRRIDKEIVTVKYSNSYFSAKTKSLINLDL